MFVFSVWLIPFTPFTWLKNHPNTYGLQASIIFLIPSFVVGLFKPQWRKWCWGVAGLAFLGVILSLLGGRSSR
jgi:phosphatidylglycerophosphate synthase